MGLALVVIEEYARATVHLRDNDALSAVYDKRAIIRHERHIAHVNFLFLHVADRLRAGIFVDLKNRQPQRHL